MTVQEMHTEFKITLDKVDSQAYPEFLDPEIDFYLNEAQDRFIKQRYGLNNIYRRGFEESQKRTDDLKALVRSRYCPVTLDPVYAASGDQIYRADIDTLFNDEARTQQASEAYMIYLKATARTCIEDCCAYQRVKLVQQDDLSSIASDPFNKPKANRPIIFFEDGDIFVWTETGAVIDNFLVTFIKRPEIIDRGTYGNPAVDCELSEYTHKEIVQMAVQIALENIESQRVQTQDAVNLQKVE